MLPEKLGDLPQRFIRKVSQAQALLNFMPAARFGEQQSENKSFSTLASGRPSVHLRHVSGINLSLNRSRSGLHTFYAEAAVQFFHGNFSQSAYSCQSRAPAEGVDCFRP